METKKKWDESILTQKAYYPILEESKVKHLRAHFSKNNICPTFGCRFEGLHEEPIQRSFQEHQEHSGYQIDGKRCWLFVICPGCDFAWSLWKLGVRRKNV